jgi:hypothetical protein
MYESCKVTVVVSAPADKSRREQLTAHDLTTNQKPFAQTA